MDIVRVFPRTVCVQLEITEEELNMILDFLDECQVDYGGKGEKLLKAGEFVTKEFFPMLEKISEDLKRA